MRTLTLLLLALSLPAVAETARKEVKDSDLGKKEASAAPDKALAGDIRRKKEETGPAAPTLKYDQFRLGVQLQVASKRQEQLQQLQEIIKTAEQSERDQLYFRLAELLYEESRFWFYEANRKDDDYLNAMNAGDQAGMAMAKEEKAQLVEKQRLFSQRAAKTYRRIVEEFKEFPRTDEVLYFLGGTLLELGEDKEAREGLVSYKRLVTSFPKSRFKPDALLALGEYYFNSSKGRRDWLEKALEAYTGAADPQSQVYGYALYKQAWCHYNLADYEKAKDLFKTVVLYGELAGKEALEGGKKGSKQSLVKEARSDFVRAFAHEGDGSAAEAELTKVAANPDDRFSLLKALAGLYYDEGKDKEAAQVYTLLLKKKPRAPEAPFWQGRIVDCVLRSGNKGATVAQVRKLVKLYEEIREAGVVKDDKDRKMLEEARELSERTLSNLAVTWHNEARKTRDDETFGHAHEIYGDYLSLFPENPKAYDLRFFWAELLNDNLYKFTDAAAQYAAVLQVDVERAAGKRLDKDGQPEKPGKYMGNAAWNAILAHDEIIKQAEQAGKIKTEGGTDLSKPVEIPAPKQAQLAACERYLQALPDGEKKVEVAFKAANVYYRYNHFDEAVKRFAQIALEHPTHKFEGGERAAEVSANLVLDSYNLLGDWAKVNAWARKFYANPELATGRFKEDLGKVLEQSSFKLVGQLEANRDYVKAAEAYVSFVEEFPNSELADKALFNAAIDSTNGKQFQAAVETRKKLVARYPKSPFVPACLFANADAYAGVGSFEEAADGFEAYVAGWERHAGKGEKKKDKKKEATEDPKSADASGGKLGWDEGRAQMALFDAGVFRDGLGQYKAALRNRERFLELWPSAKDAEKVFLSIADLHERNGAYGKAVEQLERYGKKYGNAVNPAKQLLAWGRMERLYAQKLKKPSDAAKYGREVLRLYEKLNRKEKEAVEGEAKEAVARAHFADNAEKYRAFEKLGLAWGSPPSPDKLKRSIQEKARALEKVQAAYTETVKLGAGGPALCALNQVGLAYAHMARTIENAPMPKGVSGDLAEEIKVQFAEQAAPVREKAAEALAATVGKSAELGLSNECSRAALAQVRMFRPAAFPKVDEPPAEIRVGKDLLLGGDLLTAVQPVPVVTPEQARTNAEKSREIRESTSDLKAPRAAPAPLDANTEPEDAP
jgi:tetratricopeptide (TPR) repeat protein